MWTSLIVGTGIRRNLPCDCYLFISIRVPVEETPSGDVFSEHSEKSRPSLFAPQLEIVFHFSCFQYHFLGIIVFPGIDPSIKKYLSIAHQN